MAIIATYKSPHAEYKDAYLRIQRIWGSKEEGWNAWVAVFANKGDSVQKETFSIGVPYVENENPFVALYNKIGTLSFIEQKVTESGQPLVSDKQAEQLEAKSVKSDAKSDAKSGTKSDAKSDVKEKKVKN